MFVCLALHDEEDKKEKVNELWALHVTLDTSFKRDERHDPEVLGTPLRK